MSKKVLLLFLIFTMLSIPTVFASSSTDPIKVYVDGNQLTFAEQPVIENDVTLVQFRPIFEKLGIKIEWDDSTKTITGRKDTLIIKLTIGSTSAVVNDEVKTLVIAPKIVNGNTMVPLRFVSQASGKEVKWDGDNRVITVGVVSNSAQTTDKTKLGNLKGTITWQYNKVIGTKGDVDAKIFLIPKNFDVNNVTDQQEKLFAMIGSVPDNSNLFYTKANGFGAYEVGNIPQGDYYELIVSNNTTRDMNEPMDAFTELLKPFFHDWDRFKMFNLTINKYDLRSLKITENQTVDESIDFGNTYN